MERVLTIVVAEDDADDRMMLRAAARRCPTPTRMEFYQDGRALLAFLGPGAGPGGPIPDLIVTDLRMPGIGGLQVLKEVKQHGGLREIPVVVLSGSAHQDDVVASYAYGAAAYVSKPDTYDDWSQVVSLLYTIARDPGDEAIARLDSAGLLRFVALPRVG